MKNDFVKKEEKTPLPRFYLIDKRIKLNLSAEEVSRMLDVSKRYYYQLENGWRGYRMGVSLMIKLIDVLSFEALEFLEAENAHIERYHKINNIKKEARRY